MGSCRAPLASRGFSAWHGRAGRRVGSRSENMCRDFVLVADAILDRESEHGDDERRACECGS